MSVEISNLDLHEGDAAPGATEWEDALIKHNIIPAKQVGKSDDDLYQEHLDRQSLVDVHEHKSLDQLDELEDELDDALLAQYRARRLEQLKQQASRDLYGSVPQIREPDFVREVSDAPADTFVVVILFVYSKPECIQLTRLFESVASKFKSVKFVKIVAQECIHNYPDRNCPTVLIYKGGCIVHQMVGLTEWGGAKLSAASIEWTMAQLNIIKTTMEQDPTQASNKLNRNQKSAQRRRADTDSEDEEEED